MPEFLEAPWPWWMGVLGFTAVSLLIWTVEHRFLGTTGSLRRVWRAGAADVNDLNDEQRKALEAELLKATLEEFGEDAVNMYKEASHDEAELNEQRKAIARPQPRCANFVFLGSIAAGGLLSAFLGGFFDPRWTLGSLYESLLAGGAGAAMVLFAGGVLVGFGTIMSGGCASGHGFSGCSRFQKASLIGTAAFFGTGVVVSFALEALAKGGL